MRTRLTIPAAASTLLCIDMQEEHRKDERLLAVGFDRVIANVGRLQAAARGAGMPLYHFAFVVDAEAATTRRFHPRLEDGRSAFPTRTTRCPRSARRSRRSRARS